jgi:hypothetical protein
LDKSPQYKSTHCWIAKHLPRPRASQQPLNIIFKSLCFLCTLHSTPKHIRYRSRWEDLVIYLKLCVYRGGILLQHTHQCDVSWLTNVQNAQNIIYSETRLKARKWQDFWILWKSQVFDLKQFSLLLKKEIYVSTESCMTEKIKWNGCVWGSDRNELNL